MGSLSMGYPKHDHIVGAYTGIATSILVNAISVAEALYCEYGLLMS
jgi:hypothetical protein